MPDFGPNVGIQFAETASGHVAREVSDPQLAAQVAKKAGETFHLHAKISIPRLQDFLDSATHSAEISSGTVSWKPDVAGTPVNPGGKVIMFRNADATGKHKFIDYQFSFADARGRTISCQGTKDLHEDNGLDATTDLSSINLTLQADGKLAGTGVARASIVDFVRQIQNCKVTGARSDDEKRSARQAFLGFVNGRLREVYPNLPLIFKDTAQFTPEQLRVLRLCVQLLLPANLPPAGPQLDDITGALDRFLANASSSLLTTISDWLQAIGTFLPADATDLTLLRQLVTLQLNNTDRSPIRDVLQLLHLLVVFPYYAHPKADAVVGYSRPVHKPRNTPDLPVVAEPPAQVFDFVIAGSGPAGTLLAQRLSATGKSVLLLEAGPYIPERTMDSDEILGTARLYKSSGLQQANTAIPFGGLEGPAFTVLQGACLGG